MRHKTKKEDELSSFDLTAYLGTWYQVYSSSLVRGIYEQGGKTKCVRATYTSPSAYASSEIFDILNEQITPDDTIEFVEGSAQQDADRDTHFQIQFTGFSPPSSLLSHSHPPPSNNISKIEEQQRQQYRAPYWVIALGPLDPSLGQYTWSVVSGPDKMYLYILARNVRQFLESPDHAQVLAKVKQMGFDKPWNEPQRTNQPEDCPMLYLDSSTPRQLFAPFDL